MQTQNAIETKTKTQMKTHPQTFFLIQKATTQFLDHTKLS